MRNENLRAVCEKLGFTAVSTVISSGNIVFEAESGATEVEAMLEAARPRELGFTSTTIVRSRQEVAELVESRPFGALQHGPKTYLLVTFSKQPWTMGAEPDGYGTPPDPHVRVLGATRRELFTVTDMTADGPPTFMTWIERRYGRNISSRTWLTVTRILKRMG